MSLRFKIGQALHRATFSSAAALGVSRLPTRFHDTLLWVPRAIWAGYRNRYEPYVAEVLAQQLTSGMLFLDIGAHVGWWSLYAAKRLAPSGRVIACEPSEAFRLLEGAASHYPIIEVKRVGVAAEAGEALFYGQGDATSGSFVPEVTAINEHFRPDVAIHNEQVFLTTVDDLLAKITEHPTFIKVDVEGYEQAVLQGARRSLTRNDVTWLIEVHPPQLELSGGSTAGLHRLLEDAGYRITIVDRNTNGLYTILASRT